MTGYVEHEYITDLEKLTGDNTIGILQMTANEVEGTIGELVDIGRLRRALLVFEDKYDADDAHISFVDDVAPESPGDAAPALLIREHEEASAGVVLACKLPPEEVKA